MSEERFYITDTGLGLDTVSDEMYSFGDEEDFCRLFDKLNEQQATITKLKELNDDKGKRIISLIRTNKTLNEENEQLRNELTFLNKLISFFADNPMTKYSSKSELLEEMKLLEEMGLI